MTGTLGLFSLVDLFQLLSAAKRTGRLAVEHPAGLARIYFDRGQVVHAEFGELHGEEAVYALFRDERGGFEFRIGLPSPTNSIEANTENLVLEGVRRLDESRRGASEEHAVSRDAVPVVPPDGMARNVTLTPDEQRVLALVDGRRSVTRIALDLGIEPEAALLVCDRLVRTGVLKLQNRRARTAPRYAPLQHPPSLRRRWARPVDHQRMGEGAWPHHQASGVQTRRRYGSTLHHPRSARRGPVPGTRPRHSRAR
ncbi:MAG TPA: DUF4388 domain-containing protein [Trueperaceae bacterium]|nr:DUF4388 domain-containing protein [Trueperaceae bacterium]